MQYFFQLRLHEEDMGLAMVAPFTVPDEDLFEMTFGVVSVCMAQPEARKVISVKDIASVVAMCPMPIGPHEQDAPNAAHLRTHRFFIGEKPGLEMTTLQGYMEPDNEEEEDDDDP